MINVSAMTSVNPIVIMGAFALNGLAYVAKLSVRGATRVANVAGRVAAVVLALVAAVVLALVAGRRELAVCAAVVGLAMFIAAYPMVVVGAAIIVVVGKVTYPRSK